jgi:putative flippase GtrA
MIDGALRWLVGERLHSLHGQKLRFLVAGGLNTLVGLAAFPALYFFLEPLALGYMVILAISQSFCIGFSYLTNKFLVFKTEGGYVGESLRFAVFHLGYLILNLVVLRFCVENLGFSPVPSQLGFAVLVIITSYIWHSRITFSRREQ